MNKLFTKFAALALGAAMVVGVGVSVGSKSVGSTEAASTWDLTEITSLNDGDTIVIVDKNSSTALSNANGSSSSPAATSVTLNSGKTQIASSPATTLQFVFRKSGTNYQFQVSGTENYLYTTSSNTGVRVGSNTNNVFTFTDNFLKCTGTNRYVGKYGNGSDWRCYTTIHANISATQYGFFKENSATDSYSVTNSISHSSLSSSANIEKYAAVNLTITAESHWTLPASISVTKGGSAFTSFTYQRAADNKTASFSIAANIVDGNLVLSGTSVEDTKYDVNFMDGSSVLSTEQVYVNEKVTKPADPTKSGYSFVNWYADSGFSSLFDFDTAISNTTYIYAKFEEKTAVDFLLNQMESFADWGTSYETHSSAFDLPDGNTSTVTIVNSNHQTSTIKDIPVSKGGDVTFVISAQSDLTIKNATFYARQWGSKAQTMTLHYSTNNGATYTSTGVTSTNFTISKNGFATGTNAIKVTFSSTDNQVGYERFEIEFNPVTSDPKVVIDNTEDEISLSEKENTPLVKTLTLTNVTMADLTYDYNDSYLEVVANNDNKTITITGSVVGGPYDIDINKDDQTLYTIHMTITVNNTVTVTGGSTVQEGKTLQLSASSSKGADTFTWTSSSPDVATVSENGLVTGVGMGDVIITATSNNWSTTGTIEISVTFGGSYSRAVWYDESKLDSTSGTNISDGSAIKSAFSGNAITIASAAYSGTVADGKYGGLSFATGSKDGSITINMNTGYYLKSVTMWGAVVDSGTIPSVTGSSQATLMSNRGSLVNRSSEMNDLPLTWIFASDSSYVTISGSGTSTPKTRFTIYQLDLVFSDIAPSNISLGDDTSATLMATETKTLVPSVMPRNYNVDLGITWSSDDANVATVANGVITAQGTGTANVTGSSEYGNVVCAVTVIPLTASSINVRSETITNLAGTGVETLDISGKTWDFNKTRVQSLDMETSGEINGYTKYSVKIGDSANSGGSIGNQDAYKFKFEKVIVAYCLNGDQESPYLGGEQTITVSGSDTYGESTISTTTGVRNGLIETFTLSTPCSYIKIETAGNRYVSSVTFVFENAQETEFSAAEYILGLSPDRGHDVIGSCSLTNGTYIAAKRFLNAAGETVRDNFSKSSDSLVMRARERYEIWAANNGDGGGLYDGTENFTPASLSILSTMISSNTSTSVIIIVSVIGVSALGGFFFLRKRKEI